VEHREWHARKTAMRAVQVFVEVGPGRAVRALSAADGRARRRRRKHPRGNHRVLLEAACHHQRSMRASRRFPSRYRPERLALRTSSAPSPHPPRGWSGIGITGRAIRRVASILAKRTRPGQDNRLWLRRACRSSRRQNMVGRMSARGGGCIRQQQADAGAVS